MELTALLLSLGVVLQWADFQVALALSLLPLQPNVSCFYTIGIDDELTAFLSFGYPLSLSLSFPVGSYLTLKLTLPPQVEKAMFIEFNKYLDESGMSKCYMKALKLIVEKEPEDEQAAVMLLQKACGEEEVDTVDTTTVMKEIDACNQRINYAKEELRDVMLKFMDAIERSTSDDIFIETETSQKSRRLPYNRAACLLKQLNCITTVKSIRRLREERGIRPAPMTSSKKRQERDLQFLTLSELCLFGGLFPTYPCGVEEVEDLEEEERPEKVADGEATETTASTWE